MTETTPLPSGAIPLSDLPEEAQALIIQGFETGHARTAQVPPEGEIIVTDHGYSGHVEQTPDDNIPA